ncbi:MAG: hypothetical protein CEE38_18685 [Planctomycetes bacterium B3_Pla]|nr:MAG: hypothetical protein CEE38_18685 [Planctomycetes bacterium B3_Pla]
MMAKRKHSDPAYEFELNVYHSVQNALAKGNLGLLQDSCKVFHRKRYYSKDRGRSLTTDVSVEIYVAKANIPCILWIWECKKYRRAIPVDDVEEFHAKLEQLGADRTKGTIIASGFFQKSALSFAKSKGIGIARLIPQNRIDWVFQDRQAGRNNETTQEHILNVILGEEVRAHRFQLFATSPDGVPYACCNLSTYTCCQIKDWVNPKPMVDNPQTDADSSSDLQLKG